MRTRFLSLILLIVVAGFLNFWNAGKIVSHTQQLARLETKLAAEKNIHTELKVERDDLRNGSLFGDQAFIAEYGLSQQMNMGQLIYVHEPIDEENRDGYCIIDLLATKAQAKEIQILPD